MNQYCPKTDQAWNMTSLLCPLLPLGMIELLEQQLVCSSQDPVIKSTPGGDKRGLKERNWSSSKKGSFQVRVEQRLWWQVRGEEKKRDDWLLRFQSGWLGCKKRGRAGGEADLAAPSPSPACLDKTPGTCGGISMRHHTWRKRQLNPSPPVQWAPAPTSLASIWNGYVGMQLTSQPLCGCFSLCVHLKHALRKITVKNKARVSVFKNKHFSQNCFYLLYVFQSAWQNGFVLLLN